MANELCEKWLEEAHAELEEIFPSDRKYNRLVPIPDRAKALETATFNYFRYIPVINKLNHCYDQMIHPDKRKVVKKMLENAVGRLLELKSEITGLEMTEVMHLDDLLLKYKMTRDDLEIEVPRYYWLDRREELNEIDKRIDLIYEAMKREAEEAALEAEREAERLREEAEKAERAARGEVDDEEEAGEGGEGEDDEMIVPDTVFVEEEDEVVIVKTGFRDVVLTEEQKEYIRVVRLIQRHERARVVRLIVQEHREKQRVIHDIAWLIYKPIPEETKLQCAQIFQRYWTRYRDRRRSNFKTVSRRVTLGILRPTWRPTEWSKKLPEAEEERRGVVAEAWRAMEDALVVARLRLQNTQFDPLKDSIGDELRYYIRQWYYIFKEWKMPDLPDWPDPDPITPPFLYLGIPNDSPPDYIKKNFKEVDNTIPGIVLDPLGGSALIVAGHWIPAEEMAPLVEAIRVYKQKHPNPPKLTAEEKKQLQQQEKEKREKEKEMEKKRIEDLKKQGFLPEISKFLDELFQGDKEYSDQWFQLDDYKENPKQAHEEWRAYADIMYELQKKARAEVDEVINNEMDRLQEALDIDLQRKQKKKRKRAKPKKAKVKKEKKVKDPTADQTPEELFELLVREGVVKKYQRVFTKDLGKEYAYSNWEKRNYEFQDPDPAAGDLLMLVKQFCILGLGSEYVREKAPPIQSVLLAGPKSITDPLVNAVLTESGAVLFSLNPLALPENVKGKMLIHLLTKVPKLYQPAVIHIDGAEKPFYKKVPKEEKKLKPKALGSVLPKIIKGLKPQDRVLILGTTDQPWAALPKPMIKNFNKVIGYPEVDYHTMSRFWHDRLMAYPGVDREFPYSTLAQKTMGVPLELLEPLFDQVLTPERIIQLKYKPLSPVEFTVLVPDFEAPPTNSWAWAKTNLKLYQGRAALLQAQADIREKEAKKGKKPPAKKGAAVVLPSPDGPVVKLDTKAAASTNPSFTKMARGFGGADPLLVEPRDIEYASSSSFWDDEDFDTA